MKIQFLFILLLFCSFKPLRTRDYLFASFHRRQFYTMKEGWRHTLPILNNDEGRNLQIHEAGYPSSPYPWANYPYDFWNLWIDGACNNQNKNIYCLDTLAYLYDLIIFKHCYPGADILPDDGNPDISSSKKTLANYKLQYRALRDLMDSYPNTKFMLWTLAPRHRLHGASEHRMRAKEFVDWVNNEWLSGKRCPSQYLYF